MGEVEAFAVVVTVVSAGLWLALSSTGLSARLRVPAPVVFLLAAAAISDIFPRLSEPVSIRDVERIGVVALIAILFDGGLDMGCRRLRPSMRPIAVLGVAGTFLTAALGTVAAQIILPATSFGGLESTWERRARWSSETAPESLIRLSAGIEPVDDLLGDIDQSLAAI